MKIAFLPAFLALVCCPLWGQTYSVIAKIGYRYAELQSTCFPAHAKGAKAPAPNACERTIGPLTVTANEPFSLKDWVQPSRANRAPTTGENAEASPILPWLGHALSLTITPEKDNPDCVQVSFYYEENNITRMDSSTKNTHFLTAGRICESTQTIALNTPTVVYAVFQSRAVWDIAPFWGRIPLLGRFFRKPGVSLSFWQIVVEVAPQASGGQNK